ncbi:MAG: matrixin family metalloprotease [Deltaproteobacteria bacterium]|nr:matrixin family metalloprotease [Deltaproteobacteria bacterium]
MRLAILVVIASLGFGPTPASAYCLKVFANATTPYAKWETSPVEYRVSSNVTDSKILAAIDAAFATWGSVECTPLRFTKAGTFDLASTSFQHDNEAIYVFWYDAAAGFPADTKYVSYSFMGHDNTGRLKNASLAVNAFEFDWATDGSKSNLDVQNELVSMIGTVIGLRTSNSVDSVMQTTVNYGDISQRAIMQDDIDAITFLYKGATCPVVAVPGVDGCTGSAPRPDGSVPADGGSVPTDGATVPTDGGVVPADRGVQPGYDSAPSFFDGPDTAECHSKDDCAADEVCTVDGKCVKLGGCTTSAQCGDGKVCTAEGVCVSMDDGGCSCRTDGNKQGYAGLLALFFIMLGGIGLRWRRRN